jgi:hypothetical protein
MHVVVNQNFVPGYLEEEFNSSKSHTGLTDIMYYLKCYKIGLDPSARVHILYMKKMSKRALQLQDV